MPTCVAIPLLTALSVTQAAVQPPCEGWGTQDFWRTADPARVGECLAAGYSVHDRLGLLRTVLHMAAAFSDDAEVIAVLVEAGADLAASFPPLNRTPLHTAARYNRNPEIARVLLRYGADVNAVNGLGRTPLHLAALFNDNPAVVEELARATDVNIRAREGFTPLHDAARRQNDERRVGNPNPGIVKVLLRQGADLSVEAFDGGTPMRWAKTQAVADLIQSETQRRAATRERFLRLVGTRVVLGAVALTLLGSLVGVGANKSRTISWPSTHGHS